MGSGWCGPADLLASERDADVVALTVSEAQSFYCRSRGHRTVHANAETLNLADTFGYDSFDVSFLLESLEHISNKRDLLSRLRDVSSNLLIRTTNSSQRSRINDMLFVMRDISIIAGSICVDNIVVLRWERKHFACFIRLLPMGISGNLLLLPEHASSTNFVT